MSVERTFEDGQPVIRSGIYDCRRDFYHKGGYETFELIIPEHDRVLFHKGNSEDDSIACVCIAEKFGTLAEKTAVLESKEGFNEFMELTKEINVFCVEVTGR